MEAFVFFFYILVWIVLCILVSSAAKRKGRDEISYFILSFLLSPLIAFLILLIAGDSESKKNEMINKNILIKKSENISQMNIDYNSSSTLESINKLGKLLDKGYITKEEFEIEKRKLLSTKSNLNIYKVDDKAIEFQLNRSIELLYIEIEKSTKNVWRVFNNRIVIILTELCDTEEKTEFVILKFYNLYKEDLIEKLKGISSQFDDIQKYLSVFIKFGFVEDKYPHNRLK
ncbi:MAG: SHOCT domain-containing protein [Cyclobacteriaceae bacterium]|nr:SHOCT domain-containing protein [Cyclobacteriaceae bacterium]